MRTIVLLIFLCILLPIKTFSLPFHNGYGEMDQNDVPHCPFNATFTAVDIQPTVANLQTLQCVNRTLSTYYSEMGTVTVPHNDRNWYHQPYPPALLCVGVEPEDCPYGVQQEGF
jgi:hypothetical protein